MRLRTHHLIGAGIAALAIVISEAPAHADGSEVHATRPNRSLIGSGIVTLGISYGASAIVAAQSDHDGDKSLFIPVAGPWMDLTTRGGCGESPCGHETANKVFLVADGIIQALGALDILAGFVMQETVVSTASAPDTSREVAKATWRVAPAVGDRIFGLAAVGTF